MADVSSNKTRIKRSLKKELLFIILIKEIIKRDHFIDPKAINHLYQVFFCNSLEPFAINICFINIIRKVNKF